MLAIRLGNEMNFDQLLTDDDHLQIRLSYYHNRGSDEIFRNRSVVSDKLLNSVLSSS